MSINFTTNPQGQSLASLNFEIKQSGNYVSGSYESLPVPKEYLGTGQKNSFVGAALLELLLQITDRIYLKGDTGNGRGLVGSNFSELTGTSNSVSDHAFGRAIDIFDVGNNSETSYHLSKNIDSYRQGLDIFLKNLQILSKELHPDLIIVHDLLAEELGIEEKGLEDSNSPIRTRYPHLAPFINFAVDGSHRDHIHISFSAQRAGSFITAQLASQLTGGVSGLSTDFKAANLDKFKTNYFGKTNEQLTPDEVMSLLYTAGLFSSELSAMFVGIGERESKWAPGALNTKKDGGDGDFSFGAFQCNLLPKAHGSKIFQLRYNKTGQPQNDSVLGFKLAYAIDEDNNVDSLSQKVLNQATQQTIDQRIFIPYNQAWMLGTTAVGEKQVAQALKGKLIDSYVFYPWGDYPNKDKTPRSKVGFIFELKFSVILAAYLLVNNNKEDNLKTWIRTKFKGHPPFPYIEKWMDGVVFDKDGNEK